MAATKYTYSISGDFTGLVSPYIRPDTDRLTQEIRESAIVTALDYINTSGDDCDIWFKDALSSGDQTTLDSLVAAHTGEPLNDGEFAFTDDNYLKVVKEPLIGGESYHFVPNFCDRCSWWQDASYVVQFSMTDSGDGLTWNTGGTHTFWVDGSHGRIMFEGMVDAAMQAAGYPSIVPVVEVYEGGSWVAKTEDSQAADFGDNPSTAGDFYINYRDGEIVFRTSQAGKQVRASFYKSQDELTFVIEPDSGYWITLEYAEIQASSDLVIKSDIVYELWQGGAKVGEYRYKNVNNFLQESTGPYPVFPAVGSTEKVGQYVYRGTQQSWVTIPMKYLRARCLRSDSSSQLKVKVFKEFGGEFCNGVLYGATGEEV